MNRISENNLSISDKLRLNEIEMRHQTLELLLGSDKKIPVNNRDSLSIQSEEETVFANYGCDGNLQVENGASKEEIWKYLKNFDGVLNPDCFYVNGKQCNTSQIEKIDESRMQSINVENNEITFQSGVYYGIKANDGTSWALNTTTNDRIGLSGSEEFYASENGIKLTDIKKWTMFFRFLTSNSPAEGISLGLTNDEVSSMMNEVGFEPGFCTVNVNDKKYSFYYSNNGKIYPKAHYDGIYEGLTQFNNTDNFYPGNEWNFNGNIYKLDKSGHVNVPYGEDLFNCLERPKGKIYEQMQAEKLGQK